MVLYFSATGNSMWVARQLAEALAMLETVAHDSRSYNALGNACYVNGDPARAIDYLQRAADAGDEAAARNLFLIRRIVGDPAM